jgi:hypothetical protein
MLVVCEKERLKSTALKNNRIGFVVVSVYCEVGTAFLCVIYANFRLQRTECCLHIFNNNRRKQFCHISLCKVLQRELHARARDITSS